jgi:hypothetical protein
MSPASTGRSHEIYLCGKPKRAKIINMTTMQAVLGHFSSSLVTGNVSCNFRLLKLRRLPGSWRARQSFRRGDPAASPWVANESSCCTRGRATSGSGPKRSPAMWGDRFVRCRPHGFITVELLLLRFFEFRCHDLFGPIGRR